MSLSDAPFLGVDAMSDEKPHDLIGSDRVQGTGVYRSSGDKIGHIVRIMIDKRTGQAAYAVMNFGGFLGLGQESYPLPWSLLTFNPKLGGYEVNVTDDQLRQAPKLMSDDKFDMGERSIRIDEYYGVPPYWF
jgi:PRC-barrel domain